jgi:hypothetical protein
MVMLRACANVLLNTRKGKIELLYVQTFKYNEGGFFFLPGLG